MVTGSFPFLDGSTAWTKMINYLTHTSPPPPTRSPYMTGPHMTSIQFMSSPLNVGVSFPHSDNDLGLTPDHVSVSDKMSVMKKSWDDQY